MGCLHWGGGTANRSVLVRTRKIGTLDPESEAHKCLKQRIASNPTIVGLKANENGEQEKRLWSGDEVDVYFKRSAVAVEIKAGNAGVSELHRGVFQCVKYKAILCAQQISEGHIPTADCRLAIGPPRFQKNCRICVCVSD